MSLERISTALDIQELINVREQIDGLLEGNRDSSVPRADLLEFDDSYRLALEVPGITEDSLEIAIQDREVVVAGVREPRPDEAGAILSERPVGPFQWTFQLPAEVVSERSSAHLQQGLLIVVMPKA